MSANWRSSTRGAASRYVMGALLLLFTVLRVYATDTGAAPSASGLTAATAPLLDPLLADGYSLHLQGTLVEQGHPAFASAIRDGPQSMRGHAQNAETTDITLYAGVRFSALEVYVNPEMDQGFGLSSTYGVAGYPSGEAYKAGAHVPYFHLDRFFGRYVIGLGGGQDTLEDGANQIAGTRDRNNVTFTVGKLSVVDIFDNNRYAHDARGDFLNWAILDMGAFDYAADAWGYTYGGAVEWNVTAAWTLRGGVFDMSTHPNSQYLDGGFGQYQVDTEVERRFSIADNPGKLRLLFFATQGKMANYSEATQLALATGTLPDVQRVRRRQTRYGGGLNLEQQITPLVGLFMRAGMNDGSKETFDFTDINKSLSGGFSFKGELWRRAQDTAGVAAAINGISKTAQQYFAAGGNGLLIGDGALPSYNGEYIVEAYYSVALYSAVAVTLDYQHVTNPAYNPVRGPIDFFGMRLHAFY